MSLMHAPDLNIESAPSIHVESFATQIDLATFYAPPRWQRPLQDLSRELRKKRDADIASLIKQHVASNELRSLLIGSLHRKTRAISGEGA